MQIIVNKPILTKKTFYCTLLQLILSKGIYDLFCPWGVVPAEQKE